MTIEKRLEALEAELAGLRESMQTQRLEIVDEKGTLRAVLDADDDGPELRLYDERAMMRALLDVDEHGPGLRLYDAKGRPRKGLTVGEGTPKEAK